TGQLIRRSEPTAADPIRAHKVGVAKLANGGLAIFLAATPEVAPGKPTEDRRPTGLCPLALEAVGDLFDGVGHRTAAARYGAGSPTPFSAKPLRRSRQASQCPHASPVADGS